MGFLEAVCQGRTATKPWGLALAVGPLEGSWERKTERGECRAALRHGGHRVEIGGGRRPLRRSPVSGSCHRRGAPDWNERRSTAYFHFPRAPINPMIPRHMI
jgi:hypothetical protein